MAHTSSGTPQPDEEIAVLQARVRDLEAVLNQNNLQLALAFRLTPALANVLGLLLSLPVVTQDAIQFRLELAADPRLAIHRLRVMLRPWQEQLGVPADKQVVQSKRNIGYWLEPPVKTAIKAFVRKHTELPDELPERVTEAAPAEA